MEDLKIFPLVHESMNDQPWEIMRNPQMWLKPDVVLSKVVTFSSNGRPEKAEWICRDPGGDYIVACEEWTYVDDPASQLFMTRSSDLVYMKNDDTATAQIQLNYDQNDPASEHMRTLSSNEKRINRLHILSDVKIVSMSAIKNMYPLESHEEIIGRGGGFWKHLGGDFTQFIETGALDIIASVQNEDPSGAYSWLDAASGLPGLTIRQYIISRIDY